MQGAGTCRGFSPATIVRAWSVRQAPCALEMGDGPGDGKHRNAASHYAVQSRCRMVSVVKVSLTKRQGAPTMDIPVLMRKENGVKHAIRAVTAIVFSRCPLCEAR